MASKEKVAYLGPESSYSHQAAIEFFKNTGDLNYDFEPQSIIADIFKAVQSTDCVYGVVPFENSTNGSVVFTLDLLCDIEGDFRNVQVVAETYLDVHHCLLSAATDLGSITQVHSHPQAFGQCEKFLNAHLKHAERIDCTSTSKAAQLAKDAGPGSGVAAVASRVAADVHKLNVLAQDIEDTKDNTTRFLVISATKRHPPNAEQNKSLLRFKIDHEKPGALCDSLEIFKKHGLNLTSIASRPSRTVPWNYIFFVEFEGHAETTEAKQALKELESACRNVWVLGSYQDRQRYSGHA